MAQRGSAGLAWFALAAQPLFAASWLLAGALEDGYSHARSGVSVLAREGAPHAGLVIGGFVLLGLSFLALGAALAAVLPRRPGRAAAVALFAAGGAACALTGLVRLECLPGTDGCRAVDGAHFWVGAAAAGLLALTPFAVARALWPGRAAAAALAAGAAGVPLGAVTWAGIWTSVEAGGLFQRFGWLLVHGWALVVAIGLLHATRSHRLGA